MHDCERKFTFPAKFASARSATFNCRNATRRRAKSDELSSEKLLLHTILQKNKKFWSEESRFLMTYDINNQINNCYTDSYILTNDILNDIKTT